MVHCVPRCWEGSFPGLTKIPLTGHSMCCHQTRPCKQQKSLDHTCLTSLLVRKIFPLVASSHIQNYIITIIDLIWNCISAFYHRPSHTFGNIRNNLLKQATQKIIQLGFISKVTSKNLSQELSLDVVQYTPGHLSQLNDYSQVLISWLYLMEHLTFIQRLVIEIGFGNNLRVSFLIT